VADQSAISPSLGGMHLSLADDPNRAISMDQNFHARLEPLRAVVYSYPMDEILQVRASGQRNVASFRTVVALWTGY